MLGRKRHSQAAQGERETASEHHSAHTVQQSTHTHTSTRPLSLSCSLSLSISHTRLVTQTQARRGAEAVQCAAALSSAPSPGCLSSPLIRIGHSMSYSQQSQTILSIKPSSHVLHRTACPPNCHWWAAMIEAGKVMWGSLASPLVFAPSFVAVFLCYFFFSKLILGLCLASSWVIMPQRLPGGSVWQTLTPWMVGQTNQLSQTVVTT